MPAVLMIAWLGSGLVGLSHSVPRETLDSTTTIAAYVREVQYENGLGDDFYDTLKYESQGWQNKQSTVKNPHGPNGREDS